MKQISVTEALEILQLENEPHLTNKLIAQKSIRLCFEYAKKTGDRTPNNDYVMSVKTAQKTIEEYLKNNPNIGLENGLVVSNNEKEEEYVHFSEQIIAYLKGKYEINVNNRDEFICGKGLQLKERLSKLIRNAKFYQTENYDYELRKQKIEADVKAFEEEYYKTIKEIFFYIANARLPFYDEQELTHLFRSRFQEAYAKKEKRSFIEDVSFANQVISSVIREPDIKTTINKWAKTSIYEIEKKYKGLVGYNENANRRTNLIKETIKEIDDIISNPHFVEEYACNISIIKTMINKEYPDRLQEIFDDHKIFLQDKQELLNELRGEEPSYITAYDEMRNEYINEVMRTTNCDELKQVKELYESNLYHIDQIEIIKQNIIERYNSSPAQGMIIDYRGLIELLDRIVELRLYDKVDYTKLDRISFDPKSFKKFMDTCRLSIVQAQTNKLSKKQKGR